MVQESQDLQLGHSSVSGSENLLKRRQSMITETRRSFGRRGSSVSLLRIRWWQCEKTDEGLLIENGSKCTETRLEISRWLTVGSLVRNE
jgi:hypothetical protein